jgi:hypothetical protein
MEELFKRIKGGLWVAFAGFMATAITLLLQNLDVLNLTPGAEAIIVILGTAIVSQITKFLNTKK